MAIQQVNFRMVLELKRRVNACLGDQKECIPVEATNELGKLLVNTLGKSETGRAPDEFLLNGLRYCKELNHEIAELDINKYNMTISKIIQEKGTSRGPVIDFILERWNEFSDRVKAHKMPKPGDRHKSSPF